LAPQSIAQKQAAQEALKKVAGAIGVAGNNSSGMGRTGGGHGSSSNLDLFDAKEQIKLGLRGI
jgi:hypothetical protein